MSKPSYSTAERLNAIQLVLANSSTYPEIQERMAAYGFDEQALAEGQALYDQAQQAVFDQDKNTAEARSLAAAERRSKKAAWVSYQELAKILRAHFIDQPQVLAGLALNGRTPRATAAFLHRARTLIQAVESDPAVVEALAAYNIDEARLAQHRDAIEAYASANEQHEAARAAQQVSTKQQRDAMSVSWDWRARFVKVARVALREQKELLEALGVRVVPRKKPQREMM